MPSKSWQGGSTRKWRRIRAQVLLANQVDNQGKCRLAIPGVCTGIADTVHHIHGRGITGDDPRYLQATCTPCNLRVGDPLNHVDPPSNPYDSRL